MFGFSLAQILAYAIVALAVVAAGFALAALLRRARRRPGGGLPASAPASPASASAWRSYLSGHGALLLVFLIIGGALASVTSYFGPQGGKTSKGGRLIEYRQINPSEHVVYEEHDVENYRRIMVLARTTVPQNGSATVTIYGDPKGGGTQEISRIESVADSWSQWYQPQNSSKHITLKITNGGIAPGATQIDVLLYLFPE